MNATQYSKYIYWDMLNIKDREKRLNDAINKSLQCEGWEFRIVLDHYPMEIIAYRTEDGPDDPATYRFYEKEKLEPVQIVEEGRYYGPQYTIQGILKKLFELDLDPIILGAYNEKF